MEKVVSAIAGVAASLSVGGGAYALEVWASNSEAHAVQECVTNLDGKLQDECIVEAKDVRDVSDVTSILEFAGLVGIIGCGYLGYKSVKEHVNSTGILEDLDRA